MSMWPQARADRVSMWPQAQVMRAVCDHKRRLLVRALARVAVRPSARRVQAVWCVRVCISVSGVYT